jgi:hypothetical protein
VDSTMNKLDRQLAWTRGGFFYEQQAWSTSDVDQRWVLLWISLIIRWRESEVDSAMNKLDRRVTLICVESTVNKLDRWVAWIRYGFCCEQDCSISGMDQMWIYYEQACSTSGRSSVEIKVARQIDVESVV